LPTMYATSEDTRIGVVSTLAEQYQRMAQAKPLRSSRLLAAFTQIRMPRPRRTISDSTAVSKSYSTSQPFICEENWLQDCDSPDSYHGGESGDFECRGCGFSGSFQSRSDTLIHGYNRYGPYSCPYGVRIQQMELFKSHFKIPSPEVPQERALYCPICDDGSPKSASVVRYTIPQLIAHVKDTHTYFELAQRELVTSDY
jgi:hypothetical protein